MTDPLASQAFLQDRIDRLPLATALLVAFEGSLVDDPAAVGAEPRIPDALPALLAGLSKRVNGAVALFSRQSAGTVQRLTSPVRFDVVGPGEGLRRWLAAQRAEHRMPVILTGWLDEADRQAVADAGGTVVGVGDAGPPDVLRYPTPPQMRQGLVSLILQGLRR
ncbi:MAG: hypothetical protein R3E68_01000 [Burkholderiaceae bacterium]